MSCNNYFLNSCQKLLQPTFSGPLTAMSDRSFRPRPRSFAASPPSGASSTSSAPTGTASETCAGGPCPAESQTSARIHSRSSTCQTRTPPLERFHLFCSRWKVGTFPRNVRKGGRGVAASLPLKRLHFKWNRSRLWRHNNERREPCENHPPAHASSSIVEAPDFPFGRADGILPSVRWEETFRGRKRQGISGSPTHSGRAGSRRAPCRRCRRCRMSAFARGR